MRFFYLFLFLSSILFASTGDKIKQGKKDLKKTAISQKRIHSKIDSLAKEIKKETTSLIITQNSIKTLEEQIKVLAKDHKSTKSKLSALIKENKQLNHTKNDLEKKIIDIIADKFSFYLVTDKGYQDSQESIVADVVLNKMGLILKKDFKDLSETYHKTNDTINKHNTQIKTLEASINKLDAKKKSLKKLEDKREKNISNLKRKKYTYNLKLTSLIKQRNDIQKTLRKLKILKDKEDDEKRARKSKKVSYDQNIVNKKFGVKQFGSSYQRSKLKRYRGPKTISPLKSYFVKRRIGNYIDPIYNMKIFNESVVLSSKVKNAKVRNVLSGKVVFANDTAVSNKVVIVENKSGIHTIYGNMNKIAPYVEVGRKIRKGYIIGRVDRDLTFEVTQRNYHINPLELIR